MTHTQHPIIISYRHTNKPNSHVHEENMCASNA